VRISFWAAVEASLAASLAWFVAHDVLGHPQPFFAPIAAAIAMSTSYFGRSRRAVQMVVGVLLGIGVAELLVAVLGTSALAVGLTVIITMLVALSLAGGFVGEGMMFVNQAAASAILVVALRRHGTGGERAVDAIVGGGSALLIGVVLFPAAPLPRLWGAERAVLGSLAAALERVLRNMADEEPPDPDWMLAVGYDIHHQLGALAEARARATANVRIAPRRWRLRDRVGAEDLRISRFDLLANAVLSLVRGAGAAIEDRETIPPLITDQIAALALALRRLAETPQPWPAPLVSDIENGAREAIGHAPLTPVDRVPTISAILGATLRDLLAVIGEP
jgi:uncharacterized membrane protein YgaE (UPF0421/DUF939 family)